MPGLVCIGNILYWSRLEEDRLVSQFGDTYIQYRKATWF
jgi:protein-S-isoprenylcysteine O-methyltransferase Ste14